ncbi:MAG: hypothetical protein D6754_07570 [Alphaproteobacteria bacterium]|nr:MAG: hypothetical protein D6754_07570 [Alphaproteobacteria bacterium]
MTDEAGFTPDFGTLTAEPAERPEAARRFRIAILGDFSGRANRGELQTGAELGARKGHKLDVDTLDDVIGRFATTLTLPLGPDGAGVELRLSELDHLHPDELVDNVELFEELVELRGMVKSGFKRTLEDLQEWGGEFGHLKLPRRRQKPGGVPADRKLGDFARLIGDTRVAPELAETEELIRRIVAPFVVQAPSEDRADMLAAVDEALSAAMRRVLHDPDFQTVEAGWRTLDLLARRIETDGELQLTVYDVAAEEFAADLSTAEDLSRTGIFEMLADRPLQDAAEGPFGAVFGLYSFEETPPHAELLGRMAQIAAHMGAPFVSAISTGFLATPKSERHPMVAQAWDGLRALPAARYLGLATPRFLLRHPYGKKSDPVDAFDFEEFSLREGIRSLLWANPAALVAVLMGATVKANPKSPDLGSIMTLDDMPFHYMTDSDGDQVALPCTERLLNVNTAARVVERGYMPVLSMKGRNEVRLGSFQSLGDGMLSGRWDGAPPARPAPAAAGAVSLAAGLAVPEPEAQPAADADAGGGDLDDLMAGLDAETDADAGGGDDDLDALLSGLDDDGETDAGGDDDLDALLSGLDDDDGGDSDAAGDGGDDDLDALLADLGGDDDGDEDEEMDPELKALLEDL